MSWQPTRPGQWVKFWPQQAQAEVLANTTAWRTKDGWFVGVYKNAEILPHPDPKLAPTAFPPRIEPVDAMQGHLFNNINGELHFVFFGLPLIERVEPLLDLDDLPPGTLRRPGMVLQP